MVEKREATLEDALQGVLRSARILATYIDGARKDGTYDNYDWRLLLDKAVAVRDAVRAIDDWTRLDFPNG